MIHKSVPIIVYKNGEKLDERDWTLGLSDYSATQQQWGLLYRNGYTVMNYRWPEDGPREIISRNHKRHNEDPEKNPDWLRWYFDVGNKIYVEFEDLIPACESLGIWDKEE